MKYRARAVVLAMGIAVARAAATPGPALENSQRELKELQAEVKAKPSIPANSELTQGFAQLPTAGAPPAPLKPAVSERTAQELKKRKTVDKNWLINGVNALARAASAETVAGDGASNSLQTAKDSVPAQTAAQNLLEVYSAQRSAEPTQAVSKHATIASRDPLAPFLQGWLADSPVRGLFFDDYVKKINTEGAAVSSAHGSPTAQSGELRSTRASTRAGFHSPRPTEANPYLAPTKELVLQNRGTTIDSPRLTSTVGDSFSQALATGPTAAALGGPQPSGKASTRLAPSDAQKYFPQQRKF